MYICPRCHEQTEQLYIAALREQNGFINHVVEISTLENTRENSIVLCRQCATGSAKLGGWAGRFH